MCPHGPQGCHASGWQAPSWNLSQAAPEAILSQVTSWILLLGESLTGGWTLEAKPFPAWEGEGQRFRGTLSNGPSWAEEGSNPRGMPITDPGENAKRGSRASVEARQSCLGRLLRLLEFYRGGWETNIYDRSAM